MPYQTQRRNKNYGAIESQAPESASINNNNYHNGGGGVGQNNQSFSNNNNNVSIF